MTKDSISRAIELDYAAVGIVADDGPPPTRLNDLIVVGHRTRLPPVCVRTGRTVEEAEAAGTRLVPMTMSYDRRLWPTTLAILASGGCVPLLLLGSIAVLLFSPSVKVRCWACRGVRWSNNVRGVASALVSLAGMFMASGGALAFLGSGTTADPTWRWIAVAVWGGGIAMLVGGQMLHEFYLEPLRRAGPTADGMFKLSRAPRQLLDRLPARAPLI